MTGREMKFIRMKCGYTAEEFGDYIEKSGRTVYRIEDNYHEEVKARYADALCAFVGKEHFDRYAAEWTAKQEEERKWREERAAERAQQSAVVSRPRTFMSQKYRS